MRTIFRKTLICLVAMFTVGAVASASASAAFKTEWQVCKEGGTEEFETHKCAKKATGGKWSWKSLTGTEQEKTTSRGREVTLAIGAKAVTCTAITDTGNIKAGGKGEATEIKLNGCLANAGKCTAESPKAAEGTIIIKGIPTQLVEREPSGGGTAKLANELKENTTTKELFTLEVDEHGAACPGFPNGRIKGQIAAEVINLANGEVELNFPSPELKGNTLEYFGLAAKLIGKDEVSLENEWASRGV